jgi:hypothetical protein
VDVWYYAKNGEQKGPVDKDELQRLIASGAVKTNDYVWTEGMAEWQTAGRVPGLVTVFPPGAPARVADEDDDGELDGEPIPNYLPWAILVTLCCCLPGGIMSIVYAAQANSHRNAGNWAEARISAERARNWLIWSAVLGAIASAASMVLPFLQGIATVLRDRFARSASLAFLVFACRDLEFVCRRVIAQDRMRQMTSAACAAPSSRRVGARGTESSSSNPSSQSPVKKSSSDNIRCGIPSVRTNASRTSASRNPGRRTQP